MFKKVVILLRGCPNSSKSTFANYISGLTENTDTTVEICTADDFFTDKLGNYVFDATKLNSAHRQCEEKFENALKNNIKLVICANTNVKSTVLNFYVDMAKKYDYTLFSVIMEKRFEGGDNGHNVPESSLIRMENSIKSNLKLR